MDGGIQTGLNSEFDVKLSTLVSGKYDFKL